MPLLGYGIESFNVREADYNCLDSAYNAAFAKIFSSYDKGIIRSCQFYCGCLPFRLKTDIKRLKFFAKLSSIRNNSISGLFMMCGKHEFSCLLKKYNLCVNLNLGQDFQPGVWEQSIVQTFANSFLNS